ncbi:hypothetical protein C7C46_20800 [Streptomyces tateyamensis]|uniref:Uncharacterized protein n=1 Tax=Streptomyces tateyamensis TaxID=565073 RepID=A0A2V4NYN5_9ACTN|nr:hypothetical protein C7C46_20800 [Streptomyces tateyamensis]
MPIPFGLRLLAPVVPLSVLLWFLLTPGPPSGGSGALLALLTLGGWSLGVLPVHCDQQQAGPARRRRPATAPVSAAQPQPAGRGVEAGPLQDRAEG